MVGVELMSQLIIDKIQDYLHSLLPSMGLELFDIQFRRETSGWVLRLFIDTLSTDVGVSLQNCTDVSRELGHYLDVEDIIDHAYSLEVSSPGLERPLRSTEDFQSCSGKGAKVKLHDALDGQKIFEGVIDIVVDEMICMKLVDGRSIKFSYEMINKARLTI